MRTETLWQGQRRAARRHWWRQVLDRPAQTTSWNEVFDEMVALRFSVAEETAVEVVQGELAASV